MATALGSNRFAGSRTRSSGSPTVKPATTSCRPSNETPTALVKKSTASPIVAKRSRVKNVDCFAKSSSRNAGVSGTSASRGEAGCGSRASKSVKRRSNEASEGVGGGSVRGARGLVVLDGSRRFALGCAMFRGLAVDVEIQMDLFVAKLQLVLVQPGVLRVERIERGRFFFFVFVLLGQRRRGRLAGRGPLAFVARMSAGARRGRLFAGPSLFARGQNLLARKRRGRLRARLGDRARPFESGGSLALAKFGCPAQFAFAQHVDERRRVENRVVASRADADEQGKGEILQGRATEG